MPESVHAGRGAERPAGGHTRARRPPAGGRLPERQRQWIATIDGQLRDARASLPLLPRDARLAVDCAIRLFARLNKRLAGTPADQLYRRRIRVPAPEKALIIARAALGSRLGSTEAV